MTREQFLGAYGVTFRKIVMLATSPNDAECVSAFRKATKVLADAGLSWLDLLVLNQPRMAPPAGRDDAMVQAFANLTDPEFLKGVMQSFGTGIGKGLKSRRKP